MRICGIEDKKSAFTLVEALISITIVSFTVLAIISLFVVNRYATVLVKHKAVIINHLNREREQVFAADYASLTPAAETINFDTDADGQNDLAVSKTLSIENMTGFKKVYLKLAWTDKAIGDRALKEEAITYVTEK